MATAGAAAGGAGGAAAVARAIKASGVLITLEPDEFLRVLYRIENPLVVEAVTKFFGSRKYRYLTSWRGLAFSCTSPRPLELGSAEVIAADRIWVP